MMSTELEELPDIDEVAPLSSDDFVCIAEIRKVLEKHDALTRFGVALLHSHFPVAEDEILLERTDVANRVQTVQPVKKSELKGIKHSGTSWRLDSNSTLMECEHICIK